MTKDYSRRHFMQAGLVGSAGAVLAWHGWSGIGRAADPLEGVCVTSCNHWSYIGIGWYLGIESCVNSVVNSMEMVDIPPHVKTCINQDARAYEFMAEKFPEVAERLKKYLAEEKVELIGGTYGQPMGTMFGGESNIRQIVVGRETIRKALGYEMVTFLEEEEFSHPQIPQIIAGAGFRYASLSQSDSWGRAGCPVQESNTIAWKGIDGTAIPTISKSLFFSNLVPGSPDLKKLVSTDPFFKKLQALGRPLITTWEEFGSGRNNYQGALAAFKDFAKTSPIAVEFVTCKEYLDKYGSNPTKAVYLPMDAWDKSLTWGLGGDQLRILDRKVEGLLLAAERFDAIASTLGAPSQTDVLEKAWRDLLASQSHDAGLCEYTRSAGFWEPPLDRLEDHHNFPWGAIGYNHLDAAQKQGQAALDASLGQIVKRINSTTGQSGTRSVTVFNPGGWPRSDVVHTGRIYPIVEKAAGVIVKDRAGRVIPSQIVKADRDPQGNLVVANVAFMAEKVPGVGYDTYYLEFTPAAATAALTALRIDRQNLTLENEQIKIRLDPTSGGISSLIDKRSGRETLDGAKGAFPTFTGRPNANLPLLPGPPAQYDSSKSKASIDWVEAGPVRATVRAKHQWNYLHFETLVTISAGLPYVEVLSRLIVRIPPAEDAAPADIKEGYWFSLAPAFQPASVVRDFPLAVEPTQKNAFHSLTFVDLVGKDVGLLLLHGGTQWFRKDDRGVFSNLVMREWSMHFDQEVAGWPPYAEYRHALLPHGGNLSNADRLRASTEFGRPLIARVDAPQTGVLPAAKGFVRVRPDTVQLSALRKKAGQGLEIRVVEVEGRSTAASVELGFRVSHVCETNLLGAKVAEVAREESRLRFDVAPWKIRTFELA